jgi:hypothetical protein
LARRFALDQKLLTDARESRDAGHDKQFAIDHPRGLSVHVRNGEITYYCQARTRVKGIASKVVKRRIASIANITISDVKTVAAEAINAIKTGLSPDAVIRTRLAGGDKKTVATAVDRADAVDRELWTFRMLIDQYTNRKDDPGKDKLALRASSIREINDRLRDRPESAVILDRFVKELRIEDLEGVRDRIRESDSGPSSHAKFVDLSKRVLRWGLEHRRLKIGLEPTEGWWELLSHEYELGDRSKRKLTPSQVGMLLALLEAVRALEANTNDSVLGALQTSWMIIQRSSALVNMLSLSSARWLQDPAPGREGWRVYTWFEEDVKNCREIKLSVPPEAISIIERVAHSSRDTLHADSRFAFPQDRNKYLIQAHAANGCAIVPINLDRAITASSLNHALDALAGLRPGSIDLLTMVGLPRKIGPHDLRRSVTSFFENFGEGAYASALLDHLVSGLDKMSREVAAVTQGVYSAADRVFFKSEGLDIWMAAVLPHYEAAKSDPRLLKAVEARKKFLVEVRSEGGKKGRQAAVVRHQMSQIPVGKRVRSSVDPAGNVH